MKGGRSATPCKEPVRTPRNRFRLYRRCTASCWTDAPLGLVHVLSWPGTELNRRPLRYALWATTQRRNCLRNYSKCARSAKAKKPIFLISGLRKIGVPALSQGFIDSQAGLLQIVACRSSPAKTRRLPSVGVPKPHSRASVSKERSTGKTPIINPM